ncbi:MAG: hypothetical protein LBB55_03575 [Zoogloeaceae bacterium]|jgi:hypothetical protein|nr:hypothetical protein [Zoogloeaceae bacterium]
MRRKARKLVRYGETWRWSVSPVTTGTGCLSIGIHHATENLHYRVLFRNHAEFLIGSDGSGESGTVIWLGDAPGSVARKRDEALLNFHEPGVIAALIEALRAGNLANGDVDGCALFDTLLQIVRTKERPCEWENG